jgi:hypothetical protein
MDEVLKWRSSHHREIALRLHHKYHPNTALHSDIPSIKNVVRVLKRDTSKNLPKVVGVKGLSVRRHQLVSWCNLAGKRSGASLCYLSSTCDLYLLDANKHAL